MEHIKLTAYLIKIVHQTSNDKDVVSANLKLYRCTGYYKITMEKTEMGNLYLSTQHLPGGAEEWKLKREQIVSGLTLKIRFPYTKYCHQEQHFDRQKIYR
jgi:hypothetical protein